MSWILVNCVLRGVLTIMMAVGIVWFEHWLTKVEKVGMGLIGGAVFMTLPVIISAGRDPTPFDGWASCLTAVGLICFFSGWMWRKRQHDLANARQVRVADAHFAAKARRSQGKVP